MQAIEESYKIQARCKYNKHFGENAYATAQLDLGSTERKVSDTCLGIPIYYGIGGEFAIDVGSESS